MLFILGYFPDFLRYSLLLLISIIFHYFFTEIFHFLNNTILHNSKVKNVIFCDLSNDGNEKKYENRMFGYIEEEHDDEQI